MRFKDYLAIGWFALAAWFAGCGWLAPVVSVFAWWVIWQEPVRHSGE
jgi:hypothetical protein